MSNEGFLQVDDIFSMDFSTTHYPTLDLTHLRKSSKPESDMETDSEEEEQDAVELDDQVWEDDNGARAKRDENGNCEKYKESLWDRFSRIGLMVSGPDLILDPEKELDQTTALSIYGTS